MAELDVLRAAVGATHVLTGADAEPYAVDWRGRYRGKALAVVRPGSTGEVASVVRDCAAAGIPVIRRAATPDYVVAPPPTSRVAPWSCPCNA